MLGDKIRECRTKQRITQAKLGELLGIGKSSISEWEHGKRIPSVEDVTRLAKALNVTPEYLMGWAGNVLLPITHRRRVPVIGAIACGEPICAPSDESEEAVVDDGVDCDCALYCKGDSMVGARIHDGDLVYIHLQPDVEDGQIAAVSIDDEMTLKRVYKLRDLADDGTVQYRVELRAENPKYAPIRIGGTEETRNARIIGRAVAVRFRV